MKVKKIKKPWGEEVIWAHTDKYVAKALIINPGHRLSLQYHEVKEETIRVISGILLIWEKNKITDEIVKRELFPGDVYHVNPGQIHRFGNDKASLVPCILAEVSTPEIEDVIRIEDDYKR